MNNTKIHQIKNSCAGGEHSLLSDEKGSVYTSGACGIGWNRLKEISNELFIWRKVPISEPITSIKGGYYHNLAIGEKKSRSMALLLILQLLLLLQLLVLPYF